MLERIFGSELKIKIINFLLRESEGQAFSYAEIAKSLNLRGSIWRRELDDLLELGLIKAVLKEGDDSAKKDKSFFSLDQNFFIFPEIRSLFSKSRVLLSKKIFTEIETQCHPQLILLSGKFVNKINAPVDLLIVGNISRRIFSKLLVELETAIGKELNYSIMTEEEFKYRRYVMDIFLYNIIEGEKLVLVGNIDDLSLLKKDEEL
ncbi:hypothetical protein GW758_04505 [Candidatus Falkowbacteria bacterium]|nr:hypothetical protein [Candidatus Falkowbacteria bacterium]